MAHKSPGSDIWELALRSQRLWEGLAETLRDQGLNPSEELGWKKTGKRNDETDSLYRCFVFGYFFFSFVLSNASIFDFHVTLHFSYAV